MDRDSEVSSQVVFGQLIYLLKANEKRQIACGNRLFFAKSR
jgi:hypothetical protein